MGKTALFLGAALLAAVPAHADSLACQTVNGKTVCMRGSGSLSCRTVNGRTHCTATPAESLQVIPPDAAQALLPRAVAPDMRGFLDRQFPPQVGQGDSGWPFTENSGAGAELDPD